MESKAVEKESPVGYLARVNPKYFAAAEMFAAKRDVRFYLNGVSIEPHPQKGAIIVGSDGARMVAIHDPDGWCPEQIIVGDIPRSLLAACKAKGDPRKFTEPKALWIGKTSAVVMGVPDDEAPADPFGIMALHAARISIVDGKFPDWRRVMPGKREADYGPMPAVNPEYLADVEACARILCGRSMDSIRLEGRGELLPLVARICTDELIDRFVAIIMPRRDVPAPHETVPDFARRVEQEAAV